MAYVDMAKLRARIAALADEACGEAGLSGVRVYVEIAEPPRRGPRALRVKIEERRDVDGTDPRWEGVRGRKWEGN